ncbi:MAG: ABC transporter permease [Dehalococcoidia bacterium]
MAQQQGTLDAPAVGLVNPSLSDRPFFYRLLVHSGRFVTAKPLGAFGVIVIVLVLFAALSADLISRYDPSLSFNVAKPTCTAAQTAEIVVSATGQITRADTISVCYDPELAVRAQDEPLVRLQLTTVSPDRIQSGNRTLTSESPSADHWLGTDLNGRDLWSRIIHGSRLALVIGLGASLVAVTVGTFFGVISAYSGGWVDMAINRIVDSFQAFPPFILLLLFTQTVDKPSMYFLAGVLGLVGIAGVVRITRSAVLAAREEVYVLAARTIGASDPRIMVRHILPNIFSPIIVVFTSAIGAYILAEAGLAFVGLGDPVAISWGKMVNEGRALGPAKPLMALFVGLALTVTVLGFNLAGDALRDVLDPRLRGRSGRAGF